MTKEDFKWFHAISLGAEGWTKPQTDGSGLWNMIRESRSAIDYRSKLVLDVACWDGMWAFEAEELGASRVFAVDAIDFGWQDHRSVASAFDKFCYARQARNSKVVALMQNSVHNLRPVVGGAGCLFNIVQHMGLFYHLQNPWQALKECRRALVTGGHMLFESAMSADKVNAMFLNRGNGANTDFRTYWLPTEECLRHLLRESLFSVVEVSVRRGPVDRVHDRGQTFRLSLVAEAVSDPSLAQEFNAEFRNL